MNYKAIPLILLASLIPLYGAMKKTWGIDWAEYNISSSAVQSVEVDESGSPIDGMTGEPVPLNRARFDAAASARENARELITARILRLRIDPETEMAGLVMDTETARRRLNRIITSRIKYRESPYGHFGTLCEAEIKINEIIDALPVEYPENSLPVPDDNSIRTDYTSLIIDARGIDVEPMIFPSIFNENGLEIYGRDFVKIKTVSRRGAVSYAADEDSAVKHRKAGRKPYFTAAVNAIKGCPVISLNDHKKITSSEKTIDSIRMGMVIIIIDRKKLKQ